MKPTANSLALLLCCLCPFVFHGQILDVQEHTRGQLREINLNGKRIVDINSRLEIGISTEQLRATIQERFPQYTQSIELNQRIQDLGKVLADQEQLLSALDTQIANMAEQAQFFDSMEAFLTMVRSNEILVARYNTLQAEFFASGANLNGVLPEPYIFENFSEDLSALKEEFAQLEIDPYTISLVARRNVAGGGKVHIENFDQIEEQEYITIPRWVTTLSEAQKQQLQDLAEKAKENNSKKASIFKSLQQIAQRHFPSVVCLQDQSTAIRDFVNEPTIGNQLTETAKTAASELMLQLDGLMAPMTLLKTDLAEWTITSPFELMEQFETVVTNLKSLRFDTEAFENTVTDINAIAGRAQNLMNGVQGCLEEISNDLENLRTTLSLLKKEKQTYVQNAELEKEILQFGLDNLPEKGYINLEGTGDRANGDKLVITLYLSHPKVDQVLPKKPNELERHELVMQMVGARSEVAVGMIMANPSASAVDFDLERKFYFAPSASLLLKFGSRKSFFYNEFIDLGVGLNFASPDFDTDGSPEFGTGLIVTAFKNVLSVGYNYNVTLDTPYWFFGVNLPFNLPGIPVNTIK